MADGFSVALANTALTSVVAGTTSSFVQLHTGAPGAAGTANVSNVTTREAVAWSAPTSGTVGASNAPAWTSWAGTNGETETDISFWNASTSGTFDFSVQLTAPVTMNTGDTLTLTQILISIPTAS